MFSSQKKTPMPFSLDGPLGKGGSGAAGKKGKAPTAEEKYQQALVTANVFLEDSRARVMKAQERLNAVANNNYWFYGYFGVNMMAAVAACMALGNRIAFLRSYCGWIGLAWGYFGGRATLGVHETFLRAGVVRQLNLEIDEARRLDEQTEHVVPDYRAEAERLERVRDEQMGRRGTADGDEAAARELSIDEQADELVQNYMRRREALQKKGS